VNLKNNIKSMIGILSTMKAGSMVGNYSELSSLIERYQVLANRLEAHLETNQSYEYARDRLREINKEIKKAEKKQGKPKKKYRRIL